MKRDRRVDCTETSWLHLLGHKYTMYLAMFPGTKSPLYLGCLWVSFLMENQTELMSPGSLLSQPHPVFQPQGRHSYVFILQSRPAWPCSDLGLFCFLSPFTTPLTLPRPGSIAVSSGRPSSLKTQFGICEHPLLLYPPPCSSPSLHFGCRPVTALFLTIYIQNHPPRDPKPLRAVTLS